MRFVLRQPERDSRFSVENCSADANPGWAGALCIPATEGSDAPFEGVCQLIFGEVPAQKIRRGSVCCIRRHVCEWLSSHWVCPFCLCIGNRKADDERSS